MDSTENLTSRELLICPRIFTDSAQRVYILQQGEYRVERLPAAEIMLLMEEGSQHGPKLRTKRTCERWKHGIGF